MRHDCVVEDLDLAEQYLRVALHFLNVPVSDDVANDLWAAVGRKGWGQWSAGGLDVSLSREKGGYRISILGDDSDSIEFAVAYLRTVFVDTCL